MRVVRLVLVWWNAASALNGAQGEKARAGADTWRTRLEDLEAVPAIARASYFPCSDRLTAFVRMGCA